MVTVSSGVAALLGLATACVSDMANSNVSAPSPGGAASYAKQVQEDKEKSDLEGHGGGAGGPGGLQILVMLAQLRCESHV